MGIKTGYRRSELAKSFVTARVMFTGKTDDPILRAKFAEMIAGEFLGSRQMMYGGAAAPALQAPAQPTMGTLPPPPVGRSTEPPDPDDFGEGACGSDGRYIDAPQEHEPTKPARASTPRQQSLPENSSASGFTLPFGNNKGTPIEKATKKDLEYFVRRFSEDLEAGNSRFPDKDQAQLTAYQAELRHRAGDKASEGAPLPGEDYPEGEY